MLFLSETFEIAAFGDNLRQRDAERVDRVRVDHVDFVFLIGDDPEIVVAVDGEAVRCVDAGGQDRGRRIWRGSMTDPSPFRLTGISTIEW